MKKHILFGVAISAGWLGLAGLYSQSAASQQPTPAPSQSTAGRAAQNAHTKTEFAGQFNLPYEVQCAALKLAAGEYTITVDRQGKSQTVTFTRAGQSVRLPAKAVFPSSRRGGSAIVVRRSGIERKLEAVYLEKLRLVLYLDSEQFLQVSNGDPQIERLPIS